jgi:hypothetical protein
LFARCLFHNNSAKLRKLEESLSDPRLLAIVQDPKNPHRQQVLAKQGYVSRFRKEHKIDAEQLEQFDQTVAQSLETGIQINKINRIYIFKYKF